MSIPTNKAIKQVSYNGTNIPIYDAPPDLQYKTATPSTSQQVIEADPEYDGLSSVTVAGDADLVAENIKDGVEIFGVTGTLDPTPTLQSKSVTPSTSQQSVTADSDYDGLDVVTVDAMPYGALSTPTLNVSTGVVTAQIGTSGYLESGTSKALSLSTQSAKTVTPGTSTQTAVGTGLFTTGIVRVAGDSNLVASNIKNGVSIFGVTGTHSGVVTGRISGSDSRSLYITDAVGKENIMIITYGLTTDTSTLLYGMYINDDNEALCVGSSPTTFNSWGDDLSWTPSTGRLYITTSAYHFHTDEDYMYVAW